MTIDQTNDIRKMEEALSGILGRDKVICHAPMAQYTSFRAGGSADIMAVPSTEDELKQILAVIGEEGLPVYILGNGSNVLVRDGGFRGVVIRVGEGFQYIRREGTDLICGSGSLLSAVAREAQRRGLGGMEFASGIPGSIGGAVFMNAGAYDGEMKDILTGITVVSRDGLETKEISVDELELGYRSSALQKTGDIVTSVKLHLEKGEPDMIAAKMEELMARRNSKQPVNLPSAGSFFKRPEGYFAGKLIQDAGLKGLAVGGAQVSELHSGFIVNTGGATAGDIIRLMGIVQAAVKKQFDVDLEPEVRIIGEDPAN